MNTVVVTGADRGLGLELCREFLRRGWRVFAGQFMPQWPELGELAAQYPGALRAVPLDVSSLESVRSAAALVAGAGGAVDMLVNNAGIGGAFGDFRKIFSVNSLGSVRMVETFLPLMAGGKKRLCFVSSEAGSVALCHRTEGYDYTMSKAALNMAIRHMHNDLRPQGFTFRVFHPGWLRSYMGGKKNEHGLVEPEDSARVAAEQFVADRDWEDCLVMLDNENKVWPF